MLIIKMLPWWIFSLKSIKRPSLPLLINLGLKSISLHIRTGIPACFLGPFPWKIFFQPLDLVFLFWLTCFSGRLSHQVPRNAGVGGRDKAVSEEKD